MLSTSKCCYVNNKEIPKLNQKFTDKTTLYQKTLILVFFPKIILSREPVSE